MARNRSVFKFKNKDGIEYKVYFRPATFSYKRNGKKKKLRVTGTCDSPETINPKIIIDPNLSNRDMLETIIEEFLHSNWFELTEKEVRPFVAKVAKFIMKFMTVR